MKAECVPICLYPSPVTGTYMISREHLCGRMHEWWNEKEIKHGSFYPSSISFHFIGFPLSLFSSLFSHHPVSSLIFLFAHDSQLTDESCIYTKSHDIAQPCFYGLSLPLFSERRAVHGVSAGGSRHIIAEKRLCFFFLLP